MPSTLYVYYHTHWDREWYLPFREYQHRLLKVVDDVLDNVENGTLPCFTLDGQTVLLEDYLEFRPENRQRLETLIAKDAISIGPWYVMPDEFLVSGESLIRNLQRGIQISRAYGEETFTGYLPDTFGHSADIPMILSHFGIGTAILWRGVSPQPPLFVWQSPSGDKVLGYHLTEGYFQNVFHMGKNLQEKTEFFQNWLSKVEDINGPDEPILFPIGADHLGVVTEAPRLMMQLAPLARPITPDHFMEQAAQTEESGLSSFSGELRDCSGAYILPGVYSSRMYLKQWNRRLEWRLTRQLEQLLVWQLILGDRPQYRHELDFLWKTLLLNHPHDSICGCSVDSVHRENESRFEQIDQLSGAMVRESHYAVHQRLQIPGSALLLNLSDADHTGTVELTADYPLTGIIPEPLPHSQVVWEAEILDEAFLLDTAILPLSENKALRRRTLVWAEQVPAHGVTVLSQPMPCPNPVSVSDTGLENGFLSLIVDAAGIFTVTDKRNGTLWNNMHRLVRNAEQGDSYNAALVPGTQVESAVLEKIAPGLSGPLRGSLKLSYRFHSIDLPVQVLISLDAGADTLQFETHFTNNTPDQKIQVLFADARPIEHVVAEGHFSPVTREYDPAYRIEDRMPAPRLKELPVQGGPIQRFVTFGNQAVMTEGLTEYEVAGHDFKLTLIRAFGMLSRDDTGVRGSHAGPPLPTPEGQCLHRPMVCRYLWSPAKPLHDLYALSDWFYGGVYGFDRQHANVPQIATTSKTVLSFSQPGFVSTALIPHQNTWELRLLNPGVTSQSLSLAGLGIHLPMQQTDLEGNVLGTLDNPTITLLPYQIQTLRIPLQ